MHWQTVPLTTWSWASRGATKPSRRFRARWQDTLALIEYEIDPHSLLSLRLIHGQIQARLKAMPQLAAASAIVVMVAVAVRLPRCTTSDVASTFTCVSPSSVTRRMGISRS